MKLNLYVLQDDLPQWNLTGTPADPPAVARCGYPYYCSRTPDQLREDVIYIINAENLPDPTRITGNPSFLSIGRPDDRWLTGKNNLIYTEESRDFAELLNNINQRFFFYADLEKQLQQCVDQQMPLQTLAELLGDIVRKPIFVQGSGFKVLLNYLPKFADPTPEYLKYVHDYEWPEGSSLSDEMIRTLAFDPKYNEAATVTEPTLWSSEFWEFSCLYLNIFEENEPIARITIDEIPEPIRNRDYVLIQIMGEYLKKMLMNERLNPYNRPKDLDYILTKLLSHIYLPERRITSVVESYGWEINDSYFCAVMELKDKKCDVNSLNPVALRLSGELGSSCYTIYNSSIVFICNLSRMRRFRKDLIAELKPTLRDNLITASFSTVFHNFKDLYDYYRQALMAGKLGAKKDPTYWYFKFEDYQMEYLLHQYRGNTTAEALTPQGLRDLMEHDKQKGTEYMRLLELYLDHERSIIETVRASYVSRSTFIYQIQRIQEIIKMDLDDPDTRLLLQITFRILNAGA